MPKFLFLLLFTIFYNAFSYIFAFILYQDLFEKRVPTKSHPSSLFYHFEKTKNSGEDSPPLPNSVFPYKFSPLNIDSTNFLNFSSLACKPVTFGYSIKDGKEVFPDFLYPNCSKFSDLKIPKASIDRKSNKLVMNCKETETGHFYSGPISGYRMMKKDEVDKIKFQEYQNEVDAKEIEFVLAACDKKRRNQEKLEKNKEKLIHAGMIPIFNERLYKESLKKVTKKPKILIMVTMDSMSRRHFYRKLPNTVNFLNASEKTMPHMAIYDFKLHITFGADTTGNQLPIFGGRNYRTRINDYEEDRLGHWAMWNIMKNKGFITMTGFDDCDPGFPRYLGSDINIDHSVRQFYCLVDVYAGIRSSKNATEQRCIGPHQSHFYLLNYTLEFIRQYHGANLWIYLHINAAHEKSGQHAATLDLDLVSFLKEFVALTQEDEVFMLLGADHGMRYGHWYNSIDSYQETKLPTMFVISSKSLLEKYPFAFNSLYENSQRLTSKTDIRETFLGLVDKEEHESTAVNWLKQIAPYSRDCESLESNMLYCPCSSLTEIKKYNETVESVINAIRVYIQKVVNQNSFYFPLYPKGKFCDFLELDRVLKFYHLEFNKDLEIFKIEFGSQELKSVRIEVNALIGANFFLVEDNTSIYKPFNFAVGEFRYRIRIMQISRLDKYNGKCQRLAEVKGVPPEFCIKDEC